jgi:hypothetical protein
MKVIAHTSNANNPVNLTWTIKSWQVGNESSGWEVIGSDFFLQQFLEDSCVHGVYQKIYIDINCTDFRHI